jgi:hypothetical protein
MYVCLSVCVRCRLFSSADRIFYGAQDDEEAEGRPVRSRRSVLSAYLRYAAQAQSDNVFGSNTCNIAKPLHNAFCGIMLHTLHYSTTLNYRIPLLTCD